MIDGFKERLAENICTWMSDNELTQKDASILLGVTQPRLSNLVNKQLDKFSLEALLLINKEAGFTYNLEGV